MEAKNVPQLPDGVSNEQYQMFLNMPEKLQKKFIESYQNQQKKSEQQNQEQIDQKLREAEERKNHRFAVKKSQLIGYHDKIVNSPNVLEMRHVDQIGELALQLEQKYQQVSENKQKIADKRKAKAQMVAERIQRTRKVRENSEEVKSMTFVQVIDVEKE